MARRWTNFGEVGPDPSDGVVTGLALALVGDDEALKGSGLTLPSPYWASNLKPAFGKQPVLNLQCDGCVRRAPGAEPCRRKRMPSVARSCVPRNVRHVRPPSALLPEPLEPMPSNSGVMGRVLRISVTEIVLHGAQISALIGKVVAAGVPEHVGPDAPELWVSPATRTI